MEDDKIRALAEWLRDNGNEVSEEDITEDTWGFHVGSDEYKVLTDDEADDEFKTYQEELMDEMGIEAYSDWFQEWILNNAVDTDWFEEALKEEADYLADEFLNESNWSFGNRLVSECFENNLIDDDDFEKNSDGDPDYEQCTVDEWDLQERYKDWYVSEWDAIEWYRNNFGEDSFRDVVKEHNLLDTDAIIDELKSNNGRGCLASYDGVENEYNYNDETYYIYQTN